MKTQKVDLPPDIIKADLAYPKDGIDWLAGNNGRLTFYQVEGRRGLYWCIATLPIGSSRNRKYAPRTYAIGLNGAICTVGGGPHVKQVVSIYLAKARVSKLRKYIELYETGMGNAGQIRDRISSRRAQGQMERMAGRTHWTWNS